MSATITDYFNKASNMSGSYPAVATVTAARSTGGSTLSCDDLSSWATDTPVHFSTFKVNTDGTIDTSTQTDWKGIVNGNTITDMTRLAGAADSGNASGDRVELNPTVGWLDDLITGILVSHKQNGALKDNAVTESSIATGAVTNTKLGDGSVTSAKIGTGAISSYDKIGDDVIQARNLVSEIRSYSTSEVDTGFTWIDGKPIYRKVVEKNNIMSNSSNEKAHNISNLGTVVKMDGWLFAENKYFSLSRPSAGNLAYYVELQVSSTNVRFVTGSNASFSKGLVILEYTKSN